MDRETLIAAMNESAYSGCASFYPEAGTICTERGSDHALWCDRCLLRTGAAALAAETARADEEAKQHAGWKALAFREAAAREEAEETAHYANGVAELAMKHRDMAEAERDALRAEIARLRASSAARQAPGDRADY